MRLKLTAVVLLALLCMGFEWPGRLARLKYDLAHGDAAQRKEVVRMFAHYAASDVREPLLEALEDDDAGVRLAAAEASAGAHVLETVPLLLSWLNDKDPVVRTTAARTLGQLGDARARDALVRLLGDSLAEVRTAAIVALHEIGGNEALPALLTSLEDPDGSVRRAAAQALSGMSDARVLPPLANHCRDDDAEVRSAVLTTLGELHERRALALLLQGLTDSVESVHIAAVLALGQLGDAGAIDALRGELAHDARIAKAALAALSNIDDARAQALLVERLGDAELGGSAKDLLVERARGDAAAPSDDKRPSVLAALTTVIEQSRVPAQVSAGAEALTEIADFTPITSTSTALLAALQANRGAPIDLVRALSRTLAPEALVPLLERLEQADATTLDPTLDALQYYFAHGAGDGRAADPLLARLSKSTGSARVKIVQLLGMTGGSRVLGALTAALASSHHDEKMAALEAIGKIAEPQSSVALMPELHSRDAQTRYEAARALREVASIADVSNILNELTGSPAVDRHALLIALGPALSRLEKAHTLPDATRQLALRTLAGLFRSDDPLLSARALTTLREFGPKEGAAIVGKLLRASASRIRGQAALALSSFPGDDTRRLLRYLLQHAGVRVTTAAVTALGEIGDQRDAIAIAHLSLRQHWPVPGAAAFALARFAERGVVKKHTMQRTLCELARSREPYVRANVAAAMAAMGAPACDEVIGPVPWLDARRAPAVRVAAAKWARAATAAGELGAAELNKALRACANDFDPTVQRACARSAVDTGADRADVYAYAADGSTLLRNRFVALRLSDATVFLGYSDDNGQILLPSAPRGEIILEDPTESTFEP